MSEVRDWRLLLKGGRYSSANLQCCDTSGKGLVVKATNTGLPQASDAERWPEASMS